jgi:cytochrome c biogenesis protein CcmG/thiol:disulfide interchange protein DsbE
MGRGPLTAAAVVLAVAAGLAAVLLRGDGPTGGMPARTDATAAPPTLVGSRFAESDLRRIPAVALEAIDGTAVRLPADRVLIVNFFGSWCPPCEEEAPVLRAVAERYGGRARTVAIAVEDTADAARRFARRHGWRWPVVNDADGGLVRRFRVQGMPTTLVARPGGRVVGAVYGAVTEARLERLVRRALA